MIRLLTLPVLTVLAGSVLAQSPVPIEDATSSAISAGAAPSSSARTSAYNSSVTVTPISQTASNNAEMLYTLQLLQQEVQELRGMVEEQSYQIKQMQEEQKDRYLDLDRRLSMMNAGGSVAEDYASDLSYGDTGAGISTAATTTQTSGSSAVSGDDSAEYQKAFELIRSKDYEAAIAALMRFTTNYPDSPYAGNAYYWLGEVEVVLGKNDDALQAFGLLLNRFPDHAKIPDAKYKLGKVYAALGDVAKSRTYYNAVVTEYPGSSAAKLAQAELNK